MDGVLNEITRTVHKHESGASDLRTACGLVHRADPDTLRVVSVERATADPDASKCGGCFEDAGGY
jgi:hypothetical protein